eukprot:TRINITY_DN1733_c0_g1_i4.p1 TRINITY_DN1733_c0_g1~~TRINITY_DN1733_c0_g1_i4.p1  ORF type:complete len:387 (-),score=71.72 TRINITY_DN1733_c0_g1_i4:184-1344(-)
MEDTSMDQNKNKKPKIQKEFDMGSYNQRHIAIKIAYFGWNYYGFASQDDVEETVEARLFEALIKTRLIVSRETCNYNRCGRTDKGVSAVSQIISLNLRSNVKEGEGILLTQKSPCKSKGEEEINYTKTLNGSLPEDIRVIAWTPVPLDFDARFSAKYRTYKYFFLKQDLDLERMREASQRLLGEHDFRNFCKLDVVNVDNYRRKMLWVTIDQVGHSEMYTFTICGTAFLWHQVRCMVAVLFLIGQHLEDAQLISDLLDIQSVTGKPQYEMASELPLVLWDCGYDAIQAWYGHQEIGPIHQHFLSLFQQFQIKSAIVSLATSTLGQTFGQDSLPAQNRSLHDRYVPVLKRQRQESLEELRTKMSASQKNRKQKNQEKGQKKRTSEET